MKRKNKIIVSCHLIEHILPGVHSVMATFASIIMSTRCFQYLTQHHINPDQTFIFTLDLLLNKKDQSNYSNLKPVLETACSQKRAIDAHSPDTCPRTLLHSTRAASTTSRPCAVSVSWKLIDNGTLVETTQVKIHNPTQSFLV